MKTLLFSLTLIIGLNTFAQEFNNKIIDEKSKSEILIGLCNKEGFLQTPYSDWFKTEYDAYKPNIEVIKQLKPYADMYKITVVMATWCSDSKREIPRFYKVMDYAGYTPKSLRIICVDKNMLSPDYDIKLFKVDKIPTFIIESHTKELGRIIETPVKSIEEDLLNILKNN